MSDEVDRVEIERGVPVPERSTASFRKASWELFRQMKPGDSILVDHEVAAKWRAYASGYAKEGRRRGHACAFVSKREDGGVRIWRTE